MSADAHHEAPAPNEPKPPARPKPLRPNFAKLHANPLPLTIHPLPPLIPHNPLSVAHIALVYLSQLLFRPSSHPRPRYTGYFDPATHSVHVTDERSVRALWEHGFFGKGSLSRSEPSWLEREKRRLGILAQQTSEEVTRKRREERREFKRERAWKEKAAIEETLRREKLGQTNGSAPETSATALGEASQLPKSTTIDLANGSAVSDSVKESVRNVPDSSPGALDSGVAIIDVRNEEHLQLNMEEAMFLAEGLGVLDIYSLEAKKPILSHDLLPLFIAHSSFPPVPKSSLTSIPPDSPFLISYVAYHHFRSLGWVVRPGTKFAVDLLLYNRGPVFSHAEFAVMVLPDYSHPRWREKEQAQGKPWHWLHMVNRVQSQVRKTLVVYYVWVPPPVEGEGVSDMGLKELLGRYRVREIVLKRWIPNRSRD